MAGQIKKKDPYLVSKTDLFVLNAAFEAARAGEEGVEFAVSADEVRNAAIEQAKATQKVKHRTGKSLPDKM